MSLGFEMPENEASGDHLEPDALEHDQLKLEKPSATEPVLEEGSSTCPWIKRLRPTLMCSGSKDPLQSILSKTKHHQSPRCRRALDSVRSISAAVSIPAPPISTPRSLRRWLPGADDQLPQAS